MPDRRRPGDKNESAEGDRDEEHLFTPRQSPANYCFGACVRDANRVSMAPELDFWG